MKTPDQTHGPPTNPFRPRIRPTRRRTPKNRRPGHTESPRRRTHRPPRRPLSWVSPCERTSSRPGPLATQALRRGAADRPLPRRSP
uniref:Uncharacterized protein n=1 Tax=Siphoviridae sp. ctCCv12 TaxID=2826191 RepID=A0A8S5N5V0_9CAUD|nr:MAG TPA: hypothetical protein [Siphoviridae sp. ctCCv12]